VAADGRLIQPVQCSFPIYFPTAPLLIQVFSLQSALIAYLPVSLQDLSSPDHHSRIGWHSCVRTPQLSHQSTAVQAICIQSYQSQPSFNKLLLSHYNWNHPDHLLPPLPPPPFKEDRHQHHPQTTTFDPASLVLTSVRLAADVQPLLYHVHRWKELIDLDPFTLIAIILILTVVCSLFPFVLFVFISVLLLSSLSSFQSNLNCKQSPRLPSWSQWQGRRQLINHHVATIKQRQREWNQQTRQSLHEAQIWLSWFNEILERINSVWLGVNAERLLRCRVCLALVGISATILPLNLLIPAFISTTLFYESKPVQGILWFYSRTWEVSKLIFQRISS